MPSSQHSTRVLGRGAVLIAVFDIIIAIVGICAITSQLYEMSIWFPLPNSNGWGSEFHGQSQGQSQKDKEMTHMTLNVLRGIMGGVLAINLFILLFGVLLFMGVRNERPGLIFAWYIPNVVLISAVLILALGLAYTRVGLFAMYLPGLVTFRAFEAWIVYEFHGDICEYK